MKNRFDTIEDMGICIADFINHDEKRCLYIDSTNAKNIYKITLKLENDYIFTDLFYNVTDEMDLLFLLRQQKNSSKKICEYDTFLNPMGRVNIGKALSSAINLFKKDIISITQQIAKELKKINGSYVCILIDCETGIHERAAIVIDEICKSSEVFAKFILIGHNKCTQQYPFERKNYFMHVFFEIVPQYLENLFPKLNKEHVESLRIAAKDNISEMEDLYDYLVSNPNFDINAKTILQNIVEASLRENYTPETLKIFGIAAHLVENFSVNEWENIINTELHNNIITEEIENALNDGMEKGLVKESQYNVYEFIISIVKDALCNIRNQQRRNIHLAIEAYLSKNRPFAYDLRYYHLQEAGSPNIDRIKAICFFNRLHFGKEIDNDTESNFIDVFGKETASAIKIAYTHFNNGDYDLALNSLNIVNTDHSVVQGEIRYLEAYILWKIVDKSNAIKLLNNKFKDIYNSDCEFETKIFTKLLQLSVISNESDYCHNADTTPTRLYNELNVSLYKLENRDAEYLLNILRRKSNCALSRTNAINQVKTSFEYFSNCKEFYPYEYFYSGTNYIALLLQSLTSNEISPLIEPNDTELYVCRDVYVVAKTLREEVAGIKTKIKAYIENNFLIAKKLTDKGHISEKELLDFSKLIHNASVDGNIMFNMNLGTLYAMQGELHTARTYWQIAQNANDDHDAYFSYILENNFFIADLIDCSGNYAPPKSIPMLMSNDMEIVCYINKRNELLKTLKNSDMRFGSVKEIENYFNEIFSRLYNNMQLKMWSLPFILSDVQFWSDN